MNKKTYRFYLQNGDMIKVETENYEPILVTSPLLLCTVILFDPPGGPRTEIPQKEVTHFSVKEGWT